MAKPSSETPGPGRTPSLARAALLVLETPLLALLGALENAFAAESGAQEPIKSTIGGQAVLEGVMMRGDDLWTVTVRVPDGGLLSKMTPHKAWNRRRKLLGLPFARGPVVLADSMVVGLKAMNYSTEAAMAAEMAKERAKPAKPAKPSGKKGWLGEIISRGPRIEPPREESLLSESSPGSARKAPALENPGPEGAASSQERARGSIPSAPGAGAPGAPIQSGAESQAPKPAIGGFAMGLSVASGVALALALFVALPHVLSLWLGKALGFDEKGFMFHLVDGVLKFAILILYIKAIGLIKEIKRLYAYHGAEHKAIHAYEARLPLTPESARPFPAWHPRCGTAFLFLVLALSVLFFAIAFPLLFRFEALSGFKAALAGIGVKIALMLPLSAIAYELTRLASKRDKNRLFAAMIWPGLVLQRLTTSEPDLGQLEVAISSLESVLSFSKSPVEAPRALPGALKPQKAPFGLPGAGCPGQEARNGR
jgi:uncharacterized protein YqhQ